MFKINRRTVAAAAAAAAVAGTVGMAMPASASTASAGRALPKWVHVYHSRYRAGAHMARCFVIGNGTKLNGIVCANGVAYSAAESNGGRPYPHGAEYAALPDAIRTWRPSKGVVVMGAGPAGSTIGVTRHSIRES